MAEPDARPTLSLTASFPLDARFAPTVGELAIRMAVASGVDELGASAIGRSVETAFVEALDGLRGARGAAIDVSLLAGEATIDFSVSRGPANVLSLSQPRPK